ncbi:DUF2147 domain-containing protein [Bacteroidales bacterium]
MKKTKVFLLLLGMFFMFPFQSVFSQNKADDVLGVWLSGDKDAQVEITKKGDKFFGKIVWLKDPIDTKTGKPKTDNKNPDPALKNRPTLGMEMLKNFGFNGKDEWSDGEIYDPKSGKTYSSYMKMAGHDLLKIRGYIGVSLLGRTTEWTRVKK